MVETSWWLDSSALPHRLLWARLDLLADGSAVVFDLDGRYHPFADRDSAVLWLLEDEYESLVGLIAEGEIEPNVDLPVAASDRELVTKMAVSRVPNPEPMHFQSTCRLLCVFAALAA